MERERINVGWHKDIDNECYHASGGIGSTSLKTLLETAPNGYLYRQNNPKQSTPAMKLGTLVHEMVLEPDVAKEKYAKSPEFGDLRKKENKLAKAEFIAANEGKEIVAASDFTKAEYMAENVLKHEMASVLLDGSINESSVYWWYKGDYEDERDYKVMCKVRPDSLPLSHPGMVLDLKTTEDASFSGFAKSMHKFNYHLSAAMYLDGCNQCEQLLDETNSFLFSSFVFLVVEKQPPYNVALYEISKEDLRLGRMMYKKAIRVYHDAKEDNFPGFPIEVREIQMPNYAKNMHIV